jgi:hypothetical protein
MELWLLRLKNAPDFNIRDILSSTRVYWMVLAVSAPPLNLIMVLG